MNLESIAADFQKKAETLAPLEGRLKLVLDGQPLVIDGTGEKNQVVLEDQEADCTITTSLATLENVMSGKTNAMMAMFSGKIKVKGDVSVAMKLQSLLG